ncbi:MAG: acyltransferase [Microthrixaceae bacterium]
MTSTQLQHDHPRAHPPASSMGLGALVDATPPERDRAIDAMRALAIAVVVIWHTVLSLTYRKASGTLSMPNPIDQIPLGWAATWVLQVMPMFFIVGGFANSRSWASAQRRGEGAAQFVGARLRRLGRPVAYFVGSWAAVDLATFLIDPGRVSAFRWAFVVFVPLWFVGMYALVCAAAPLMMALHRRYGLAVVAVLLPTLVALDALRLAGGLGWLGVVSTPLVWLFVHQLGVLYAEHDLSTDRVASAGVAILGLVLLGLAVCFGGYDASMVATKGAGSNLLPTTAAIALTGVFQVGLLGLVAPALRRLAARRNVWKATVALNAFAMTILCWHMTGHLVALLAYEASGGSLSPDATAGWWQARPGWLVASVITTTAVVALFGRIEVAGRRR